jgi:hypothetical protein
MIEDAVTVTTVDPPPSASVGLDSDRLTVGPVVGLLGGQVVFEGLSSSFGSGSGCSGRPSRSVP